MTLNALQNPDACLSDIDDVYLTKYHVVLMNSKQQKLISQEEDNEGKVSSNVRYLLCGDEE